MAPSPPRIDVLLACYNGGPYLDPLLQSLAAQTNQDFRLLIRDDGSTDGTTDRLRDWAAAREGRVVLLETGQPSGSAAANFSRLLGHSRADYVLFADQDDIWHPGKVAATVEALQRMERAVGRERPVMAFCDLALVDAGGHPLHPSLRRFQGMDVGGGAAFHRLLLENVATGCAMGINAAARDGCGPIPPDAVMHDWWLALYCAAFGRVEAMPEALIDYRQHGGNAVGAVAWSPVAAIAAQAGGRAWRDGRDRFRAWLGRLVGQAAAFDRAFGDRLTPADRSRLAAFAGLAGRSAVSRRLILLRHGFRLARFVRTLGLYLRA